MPTPQPNAFNAVFRHGAQVSLLRHALATRRARYGIVNPFAIGLPGKRDHLRDRLTLIR